MVTDPLLPHSKSSSHFNWGKKVGSCHSCLSPMPEGNGCGLNCARWSGNSPQAPRADLVLENSEHHLCHQGLILHQLQALLRPSSLKFPVSQIPFAVSFCGLQKSSNISPALTLLFPRRGVRPVCSREHLCLARCQVLDLHKLRTTTSPCEVNSSLHGNCSTAPVSLTTPTVLFQAGAKLQLNCDHQGNTQFPLQKMLF